MSFSPSRDLINGASTLYTEELGRMREIYWQALKKKMRAEARFSNLGSPVAIRIRDYRRSRAANPTESDGTRP